jgi:hypothetical protein
MGEDFIKRIIVFLLLTMLVISVFLIANTAGHNVEYFNSASTNANVITGFIAHPIYPSFSVAESGFVFNNNTKLLSVTDTAVYKTGYYSINGSAWTSFTLTGTAYGTSTVWLTGTTTKTLPSFGVGEHYIIIYSCKYITASASWNCFDNRWQLIVVNNTPSIVPPVSNCNDGVKNGDETGVDCGGSCSACQSYSGTIYYISSSAGSTTGDGSINNPWKTISQVNAHQFKAGDAILFKRGDTWYGTLTVTSSGSSSTSITYGAYGTGNKPIITGFTTITGWTNEGNGIYSTIVSTESAPNMVTVDGKNTAMGRWPNSGYMTIDSASGTTSITDAALPSTPDWDGAEVVIRKNHWIIDRNPIISHSGSTISYTSASSYPGISGYGYFIQNDIKTLDTLSEWYYDDNTNKLYMYFGANNANNHIIKISTLNKNIQILSKNYITIDNLALEGSNTDGIYLYASNHITVQGCSISFSGRNGINTHKWESASSYLNILNNTVTETQNNAIDLYNNAPNSIIRGNVVSNTGELPGMTVSGDGNNVGIQAYADNTVLLYNRITNTGYIPLAFAGSYSKVRYTFIDNYGYVKDDVGGIYTSSYEEPVFTGREITDNIVLNGIGANEGTADIGSNAVDYVQGIYLDLLGEDVLVQRNTVYNVGSGIFLHNYRDVNIWDNTIYDIRWTGVQSRNDEYGPNNPARNVEIQRNKFVILDETSPDRGYPTTALWLFSRISANDYPNHMGEGIADLLLFGTTDNNYYAHPISESSSRKKVIVEEWGSSPVPRTLAEWKTYMGQDTNSKISKVTVSSANDILFYYNEEESDKNIVLSSGNYADVEGTTYSGSITLKPYTSIILIKN